MWLLLYILRSCRQQGISVYVTILLQSMSNTTINWLLVRKTKQRRVLMKKMSSSHEESMLRAITPPAVRLGYLLTVDTSSFRDNISLIFQSLVKLNILMLWCGFRLIFDLLRVNITIKSYHKVSVVLNYKIKFPGSPFTVCKHMFGTVPFTVSGMPKLIDFKFPAGCTTLPEGFWSAVDVWIKKPHVVNKRLCGVKETESENVGREALQFLLDDPELSENVFSFLTGGDSPAQTDEHEKPWSSSVRTFIPKVNCYGTNLHKELILKGKSGREWTLCSLTTAFLLSLSVQDFDRQQVTFLPFEEDSGGQSRLKRGNIYQIQLLHPNFEEWWVLKVQILSWSEILTRWCVWIFENGNSGSGLSLVWLSVSLIRPFSGIKQQGCLLGG